MNNQFDELTKEMAQSVTRRAALKKFGLGLAGSSFVAVSRVVAGDHFPTDVIAGAGVGASFGVLLPALHTRRVHLVPIAGGIGATGSF